MTLELITTISPLLQTVVLGVLLFFSIRLLLKKRESVTTVFLSFSIALLLFSDLYWVIFDILRPDSRMPFAANEFGEAALFLMIAAILNSAVPRGSRVAIVQSVCALIFAACNAALWIAWSGEWIQDILIGLVVAWLMYSVVCSLKVTKVLSRLEWILLGVFCTLLITGQCLTFVFDDPIKSTIDAGCYVLLSAGIVYWLVKLFISYRKHESPKKIFSIVITVMTWNIVSLYMSADLMYIIFFNIQTIILVFEYLAARKVVSES